MNRKENQYHVYNNKLQLELEDGTKIEVYAWYDTKWDEMRYEVEIDGLGIEQKEREQ